MNQEPKLGRAVTFKVCYALKASSRHSYPDCKLIPITSDTMRVGYVVGIRYCLMDDYQFKHGYQSGDEYGSEYVPASARGKPEKVMLVCTNIRHKPVIVRFRDVVDL